MSGTLVLTHLAVHVFCSTLCILAAGEAHKTKPSRPSSLSVSDNTSCNMKDKDYEAVIINTPYKVS